MKILDKLRSPEYDHDCLHRMTAANDMEQMHAALLEARAAIVCRTFDESALSAIDAALALNDRDA